MQVLLVRWVSLFYFFMPGAFGIMGALGDFAAFIFAMITFGALYVGALIVAALSDDGLNVVI